MRPFRAFAALSVPYTVLVCYYSFVTGMGFYGAGGTLLTLVLIPPLPIFVSVGVALISMRPSHATLY